MVLAAQTKPPQHGAHALWLKPGSRVLVQQVLYRVLVHRQRIHEMLWWQNDKTYSLLVVSATQLGGHRGAGENKAFQCVQDRHVSPYGNWTAMKPSNATCLRVPPDAQLMAAPGLAADREDVSRKEVHERGLTGTVWTCVKRFCKLVNIDDPT